MTKVGIIGAMETEVQDLIHSSSIRNTVKKADMTFYEGVLEGTDVVIVQCGMGKVNAGICVQILVDQFEVTHVINTGVAGSLNKNMDIGDIVVSTEAVQHDYDVEAIGFQKGEIPYTGKVAFEADERLRKLVMEAASQVLETEKAFEGRILSGDQFISSSEKKHQLISEFGGYCAEMEGGAIAQACYLNHIPFVIIRAISDKADDTGDVSFEAFAAKAAINSINIVKTVVPEI